MEDFIRTNFVIAIDQEGNEIFQSSENCWTELQAFLTLFSASEPTYNSLTLNVGTTGFQPFFDAWKADGIIN